MNSCQIQSDSREERGEMITVRPANQNDGTALWYWFQDPLYSFLSRSHANSVSKDEHRKWFSSVLQRDVLLIGIKDNLRMGVAWFELDKRRRFNVFIKSKYSGQIYFGKFLDSVIGELQRQNIFNDKQVIECASEQLSQLLMERGFSMDSKNKELLTYVGS